jgi:hypothetical protein
MGNFIVNESSKDVIVTRAREYRVPAHSIVAKDVLVEALRTDYHDIDLCLEAQYPELRILSAMYIVSKAEKPYKEPTSEYDGGH